MAPGHQVAVKMVGSVGAGTRPCECSSSQASCLKASRLLTLVCTWSLARHRKVRCGQAYKAARASLPGLPPL